MDILLKMVGKYKVITLCGSTKFKEAFLKAQKDLTLQGNIVISVGLFGHSGDDEVWNVGTKEMLDDMHKKKIDMADEIYVINVDGYIGESTKSEIEYAKQKGKVVRYLEPIQEGSVVDESPKGFIPFIREEWKNRSKWFRGWRLWALIVAIIGIICFFKYTSIGVLLSGGLFAIIMFLAYLDDLLKRK